MKKTWFWITYLVLLSVVFHALQHSFNQKEISVFQLNQEETYGFTIQVQNHLGESVSGVSFHLYDSRESTIPLRYLNQSYVASNKEEITVYLETTTRKNGILHFYGLPEGTYYLEETKVPGGYQLLENRITVRVDELSSEAGVDYYIINGRLKKG